MKSYTTKFKSFLWKIVQMGTLQKLQNSIQTLLIFWHVYPILPWVPEVFLARFPVSVMSLLAVPKFIRELGRVMASFKF